MQSWTGLLTFLDAWWLCWEKCQCFVYFVFLFHTKVWCDWLRVCVMLLREFWKKNKPSTSWPFSTKKSLWHLNHWKFHDLFCSAGCIGGEGWSRVGVKCFALCFGERQWHKWRCGCWVSGLIGKRNLRVFVRRACQASCLFLTLFANAVLGRGSGCNHDFLVL